MRRFLFSAANRDFCFASIGIERWQDGQGIWRRGQHKRGLAANRDSIFVRVTAKSVSRNLKSINQRGKARHRLDSRTAFHAPRGQNRSRDTPRPSNNRSKKRTL